jgi:hypothetical protein
VNILAPELSIIASVLPVSLCTSTTIRFGSRRRTGNRLFNNIEWLLTDIAPSSLNTDANQKLINDILLIANNLQLRILTIPELIMPELADVTFQINFKNFLNNAGSTNVVLQTLSKISPFVEIMQEVPLQFYRW